ncbi:MAG TPA: M23 family metallopeptidase [Stellaceae bacterium]|jgi:murein DD-endopeptidase MepM/ murein hydrolase activator NlpD|nr:M23 family metallopeptidase [Stellaceae bacterium]
MEQHDRVRRRALRISGALLPSALLLAACGPRIGGPAPVVNGELGPPPPTEIVVERGQTLSGIAHSHHVPMSVVADANHLAPPYRILVGQTLVIPGGAAPPSYGPAVAMGEPAAPPPPAAPQSVAPQPVTPAPPAGVSSQPLAPYPPPPASAATPPAANGPAVALAPPPPRANVLSPPAAPAAPAAKEAHEPPGPIASAEPPPRTPGGTFLWPVRGRVLEGYGSGPDGTHNDGINIAAPRGAAVEATDGGVVAYAGNELRGYGNLVLIKHPNGWISAYAHCDLILVKTGQKVARGQVIARVGATGNVSEPQLHFELRRGKKPVDPREYLAPPSTAATGNTHPG